jgi:hypothetical protein
MHAFINKANAPFALRQDIKMNGTDTCLKIQNKVVTGLSFYRLPELAAVFPAAPGSKVKDIYIMVMGVTIIETFC